MIKITKQELFLQVKKQEEELQEKDKEQSSMNDCYEGQLMDKEHDINELHEEIMHKENEIKSLKEKNLELIQRFEEKFSISDYEQVKSEKEHYKKRYLDEKDNFTKYKNDLD